MIPNYGKSALILYNATSIPSHCGVVMLLQHKKGSTRLLLFIIKPLLHPSIIISPYSSKNIKKNQNKKKNKKKKKNIIIRRLLWSSQILSADRCTLSALHALLETDNDQTESTPQVSQVTQSFHLHLIRLPGVKRKYITHFIYKDKIVS